MAAGQVSQMSPSKVPRTSNAFSRRSKAIFLARIQNTGGIRDGNESENDVDWAVLLSGRWLSTAENLTPPSKPTLDRRKRLCAASRQAPLLQVPFSAASWPCSSPKGTGRPDQRGPSFHVGHSMPCVLCPVSPCVTVPRPRRLSMPGHWSAEHSALLASVVLCYTRESLPAVISKNLSSQDCISAACKSHFPKSGGMPTLLRGGPRDVTNNNQCRKC